LTVEPFEVLAWIIGREVQALAQHLYAVIGLMWISDSWDLFKRMLDRAYRICAAFSPPRRPRATAVGFFWEKVDSDQFHLITRAGRKRLFSKYDFPGDGI
jgi:hypothetical protein